MVSQGWALGEDGMEEQGHASPKGTPSICVRDVGQMLPRPSVRTFQSVGMVMIGTEEAWVEGWVRR